MYFLIIIIIIIIIIISRHTKDFKNGTWYLLA